MEAYCFGMVREPGNHYRYLMLFDNQDFPFLVHPDVHMSISKKMAETPKIQPPKKRRKNTKLRLIKN